MHKIKVVQRKECGNCEEMMPELLELSQEIPIEFIDADTYEGKKEIVRTGLPEIILPLVNVDDRYLLVGRHSNPRQKILTSLVNSPGISERPDKLIIEKEWYRSEKVFCAQDVEFDLHTGQKVENKVKCFWRGP